MFCRSWTQVLRKTSFNTHRSTLFCLVLIKCGGTISTNFTVSDHHSLCGCWILTSLANLKELISQTITTWAQESHIQDPELVRVMFSLLRRQYDGIGELLRAMKKSYTISAASVQDAINLLASLGQIRSLLSVRMGKEEEKLMIDGLGWENLPP